MVVSFALGPVPLEERYDIYIFYIRGNSNIPLFVDLFAMVSGSLSLISIMSVLAISK